MAIVSRQTSTSKTRSLSGIGFLCSGRGFVLITNCNKIKRPCWTKSGLFGNPLPLQPTIQPWIMFTWPLTRDLIIRSFHDLAASFFLLSFFFCFPPLLVCSRNESKSLTSSASPSNKMSEETEQQVGSITTNRLVCPSPNPKPPRTCSGDSMHEFVKGPVGQWTIHRGNVATEAAVLLRTMVAVVRKKIQNHL